MCCVFVCVRACVHACMRACMRLCVCVCVCVILVDRRMCETCKGANTKLFWTKVILAPLGVTCDTFEFLHILVWNGKG